MFAGLLYPSRTWGRASSKSTGPEVSLSKLMNVDPSPWPRLCDSAAIRRTFFTGRI